MTSMRHAVTGLSLTALFALVGCGSSLAPQQATNANATTDPDASYPTQRKTACELLTQDVATSLLGDVTQESDPVPESGNANVRTTSCVRASSLANLDREGAVSLVVRVAQNNAGARANAEAFRKGAMPRAGREVSGYGDRAFWNPTVGQLNILDQGNWYVLASGPIDPTKHTLKQTRKLADALADKL